jgi:threonine/homoserine/homoserine lactone efflux protein
MRYITLKDAMKPQTSMTLSSMAVLFGVMAVLAAIPTVSMLTVSARSATTGLVHGVFATISMVLADLIFVVITIAILVDRDC